MRANKQTKFDIVNIISKYVNLEPMGHGYIGICPFCGAKGKNSFAVLPVNQKYSCSRCGAKGGIFQFLLHFKGVSLAEALDEVRQTFNISYDGDWLDSHWNQVLEGTDFQSMFTLNAKAAPLILTDAKILLGELLQKERSVSYTEIATFIRCPLEYKLRYLDHIQDYEPSGKSVRLGRFLHSVASSFFRHTFVNRNIQLVHSLFSNAISKTMDEDYKNELRQFEDPTARLLVEYFADKNIADTGPGFETPFGSAIIKGTADLLITSNDGICIVEFKEHDYRESNNKFDFLPYLQLLFYYFGLISRNVHINRGWYGFFCNGTVDEVIFTQQMINDAKNYLEQIFQELIECQVFESRPNILCGTCGYRSKCTRKTEGSKV